ncbi:MAG: acyl-CoA dehydrogenase family protein [Nitrospirae bacterium]|nr:acyl-CoA dehydrogenase family protein [Nitrospirota bacterium]
MDFELTEEQRMIREMTREFAEREILPRARENDLAERFPREILSAMAPLGLLGGPVPKAYGGAGLDYVSHAVIIEEIGRACSSVRTTLSVQVSLVELSILRWGMESQRRRYLPGLCRGEILGCFGLTEPDAGSDAAGGNTTAVLDRGEWVLNGTKTWISNGGVADVALVFARTDPAEKYKGLTAFLVDRNTPGFSTPDITGKMGLRSSNTAELLFQDCRIPGDAVLGGVGEGFRVAMSALDNGRYSVAAGCVGIIQGCLDHSIVYARRRRQFDRPIGGFQLVQDLIARMKVDLDAARLLVYRAGALKDREAENTLETSVAKLYASEAAVRASDTAIQIHGAYGYSNEYPLERYYRDARVATIYEGTSQIQKLIIGSHLLGIKAFV